MSDDFEETVADVVDEQLTPTPHEPTFSRQSSGVCHAADCRGARLAPTNAVENVISCSQCPKTYKTLKGYQKHVFLHNVKDYNQRKPDMEVLVAMSEDIVTSILNDMKEKCHRRTDIVNAVLESIGSNNWIVFLQALTEPICEALSSRTKLMPSNQYVEFFVNFNRFLNDKRAFSVLKSSFEDLVPENLGTEGSVDFTLLQLCNRAPEEIQLFIAKEMVKGTDASSSQLAEREFNVESFSSEISNMLRCYFIKACKFQSNEVWRLRCSSIQSNFVSYEDDTSTEDCDLLLKHNWTSGSISPSPNFFNFCKGVESVIQSKLKNKELNADKLIADLLDPVYADICNCWHSLTQEYFSEVDSLVFMRDFVTLLLNRSIQVEEKMIRGQQEQVQKLQKVALRENLHRN